MSNTSQTAGIESAGMEHALPRHLTEKEVAKGLLISQRRLQELCREDQIDYVRVSPRTRGFTAEQICAYIQQHTRTAKKPVDTEPGRRVASPKRTVKSKGGEKKREKLTPVKDSGASLTTKEIRGLCQ